MLEVLLQFRKPAGEVIALGATTNRRTVRAIARRLIDEAEARIASAPDQVDKVVRLAEAESLRATLGFLLGDLPDDAEHELKVIAKEPAK